MPRPNPNAPNLAILDLDSGTVSPLGKSRGGRGRSKKPDSKIGDFVMVHLEHTTRLFGLTGTERDVLDALVRRMEPERPFTYQQREIADELGKDQSVISKATKVLRERGLLIKLPYGRSILDPRVFWVGNRDKIQPMIEQLAGDGLLLVLDATEEPS